MEQNSKDTINSQFAEHPAARKVRTWGIPINSSAYHSSTDVSLFSSSLPVLRHEKLNFNSYNALKYDDSEHCGQSLDDGSPKSNNLELQNEDKDPFEDVEPNAIGNLLPNNEEELLAGIMDDFDFSGLPSQVEDLEEYDLFGSGGGMELDVESQESLRIGMAKLNLSDGVSANGHYAILNGVGTVAGEHPYGEHPSRTLFVRNINSNVEDSELRSLFEQYGDIRTLYTACKHRGFVMISYYDIRDARAAMRGLQNKPLRRRKLDIHFSIPKDNPSEKDINQGTLVVFNLDASVSNDDLRQIFGAYGEVKEIRETPHKRHHKFIEFYDVRSAEAALRALNRSDIAGKRIKLEPSRPGGARRNLMQQLSQELEQDEARSFRHQVGSPVTNSPPGNWTQYGSPVEHNPLHGFSKSPGLGTLSPVKNNNLPELASVLTSHMSNPVKIAPIGKDHGWANHANHMLTNNGSIQGTAFKHYDQKLSTSPVPMSAFGESNSNSNSSSIGTLSGPQFLWGSPAPYSDNVKSSGWPISSVGQAYESRGKGQGFQHPSQHSSLLGSHYHQHVGSAPSGLPLDRHLGFFPESPETSFITQNAFGGVNLNHNNGNFIMNNMGAHASMGTSIGLPGSIGESTSPNLRMMSFPRQNPMFLSNYSYSGPGTTNTEGYGEHGRNQRLENFGNQTDSKKQYQLNLDKIISGEDSRTTLMIKNIPNKYTSKMLLAAIDENHRGSYDFLYLPIDFKNKCNVGYAFINMVSPSHIIPFYEAFNGKKWEKFNSEKVASLAYARIQGKAALVSHFQNSSLMNEDKRCRPILFHSEGQEACDQEPFVSANLNICIRQPDGSYSGDSLESPKGSLDEKPDRS